MLGTGLILGMILQGIISILLLYILYFFVYCFIIKDNTKDSTNKEPVSILIAAKNEYENLTKLIPLIMEQEYTDFELIVINDSSEDETVYLIKEFQQKYSNLRLVDIPEKGRTVRGKKLALTLGIKAAKHDIVLLTDADCTPVSPFWIERMASKFTPGVDIVLGISQYEILPNFLNKVIRFETFKTALMYLSFAKAGIPYMGVGRNLAYRKRLFFDNKGFAKHMHILSGDDDLFVNQNANAQNTAVCMHQSSIMMSKPKKTLDAYIGQKIRHIHVGKYYKSIHKLLLSSFSILNFLFYALVIALPFFKVQVFTWYIVLLFVVLQWALMIPPAVKLKSKDIILLNPILDVIYTFKVIIIGPYALLKKLKHW